MDDFNYKTSKDYTHLKELLDNGQQVVCFVEWVAPSKNVFTDICKACVLSPNSPEYRHYSFSARGIGYGDYWPQIDDWSFEEHCESLKLEYIEPNGDN